MKINPRTPPFNPFLARSSTLMLSSIDAHPVMPPYECVTNTISALSASSGSMALDRMTAASFVADSDFGSEEPELGIVIARWGKRPLPAGLEVV